MRLLVLMASLSWSMSNFAHAKPTPHPAGQVGGGLITFQARPGAQLQTETMLDQQNRNMEMGNRNSFTLMNSIATGQSRAQEIMKTIQNEDLRIALEKVTKKGQERLEQSPELRNPAAVIGAAMALWMGRTMKLFESDGVKFSSHLEGRGRQGGFFMESPLVNGKLRFSPGEGVSIQMDRRISSINANAEFLYNVRSQSVSTQLRHTLAPNIDLTFGASQRPQDPNPFDGRAGIEYRLSF